MQSDHNIPCPLFARNLSSRAILERLSSYFRGRTRSQAPYSSTGSASGSHGISTGDSLRQTLSKRCDPIPKFGNRMIQGLRKSLDHVQPTVTFTLLFLTLVTAQCFLYWLRALRPTPKARED